MHNVSITCSYLTVPFPRSGYLTKSDMSRIFPPISLPLYFTRNYFAMVQVEHKWVGLLMPLISLSGQRKFADGLICDGLICLGLFQPVGHRNWQCK